MNKLHPNYLVDTDIFVDYFRGNTKAAKFLEAHLNTIYISVLTLTELLAGSKKAAETAQIQNLSNIISILPIDEKIAIKGGFFRQKYGSSHGTGIVDALLAATSLTHEMILITKNIKHYPMLKHIKNPLQ